MRKLILIACNVLFSLISFTTWGQEKNTSEGVCFEGGNSKFIEYLGKGTEAFADSILCSHYIFYKLSIGKKGGIDSVELLNTQSSYISSRLEELIKKKSGKWKNNTAKDQTVILPIFLIKDLEDIPLNRTTLYTIGPREYKESSSFLESYFITPVIVKFAGPFIKSAL
ncbi:MAG: hypothetical protein J7497_12410 [Chitinophagaceae bacterium]|nr:hypothetical protein [Chitinophagaceae bacterium]